MSQKKPSYRIGMDVLPENAFVCVIEASYHNDAWKPMIDVVANHGMYNFLTITQRLKGRPIVDPETKALFRRMVDYAGKRGLASALDLDPRLARAEFLRRYPDEAQRIVYLHQMTVKGAEEAFEVVPESFHDHMTGGGTPYLSLKGRFIRALAFRCDAQGEVLPESVSDVSAHVVVDEASSAKVKGVCKGLNPADKTHVIVLVEFDLFTPDVFSSHLIAYQRELLEMYADLPLRGAVKDEWGFPPTSGAITERRAFWYSPGYEAAYKAVSGGRSLMGDLPLMALPHRGLVEERLRAITRFMMLNFHRQRAIEEAYYHDAKAVFGADAYVTKHATWYPRINNMEIFKNGISWWAAKRDIAQSDEITPLSACTGMCKKFNSPVWMNEGYSSLTANYRRNIWRYALAGGRMVYHPLYPCEPLRHYAPVRNQVLTHGLLLSADLIRAECRVRLLNFISKSPLDCPVAFVFGHESLMNWGAPGYLDYGEALSLGLWQNGYAVDLYPSSEIEAGTFTVTDDGYVRVGHQKYQALIFHHPDLCPPSVAEFFQRHKISRTALYRVGDWSRDAWANPFDGNTVLGAQFKKLPDGKAALPFLKADLGKAGIIRQPPLVEPFKLFHNEQIGMPAPEGTARLIDGTIIRISATRTSDAGDVIEETLVVNGVEVQVKALGLFAARADMNGRLEAFAAGGLSYLRASGVELKLDRPLDLALWRDAQGEWCGVVQDHDGVPELPKCLLSLTHHWKHLSIPPPYIPEKQDEPVPDV